MTWLNRIAAAGYRILPTVDISVSGQTVEAGSVCYAGFTLRTTGLLYSATLISGASIDDSFRERWLETGRVDQVWVERTINSGDLDIDGIGASRVSCTIARDIYVLDTDPGVSGQPCNVTLNFYDAAAGGNLLHSRSWTLSANYTTA